MVMHRYYYNLSFPYRKCVCEILIQSVAVTSSNGRFASKAHMHLSVVKAL